MAEAYKNLGLGGVNIVRTKYAPDDKTVLGAQNAELVFDKTKGGKASLRKRGGYATHGAGFGAGLSAMFEVKFIDGVDPPVDPPEGTTEKFWTVTDGTNLGYDNELINGTNLWASLDEVDVPSDTDFIRSSPVGGGSSASMVFTLTPVVFTGVATAGTVKVRARLEEAGFGAPGAGLYVRLSFAFGDLTYVIPYASLTSSFQTFTLDFITDFGYLGDSFDWSSVALTFIQEDADDDNFEVSWFQMELTHA